VFFSVLVEVPPHSETWRARSGGVSVHPWDRHPRGSGCAAQPASSRMAGVM